MMRFSAATAMINHNNDYLVLPPATVPRPWPWYGSYGSMAGFGDASNMERLLVHFVAAVEANDATLAQQILWVLNNIAPSDGDSNQRLTSGFLRALILRAARNGTCKALAAAVASSHSGSNICLSRETYRFSVVELAAFVDLTPWHRFGFTAANSAIVEAIQGFSAVHVVEIGSTHCMQIPTLIDAIANKFEVPPLLKLTVVVTSTADDDLLSLPIAFSYEELGSKLVNFARSRNINAEFRIITSSYTDAFSSLFDDLRKKQPIQVGTCDGGSIIHREALVINCQMMLHYMLEDQALELAPPLSILEGAMGFSSPRTTFLNRLRSLDPTIVTLVDEDADLMSNDIVTRLRSAFNYLWIPYDVSDAVLPKGSEQRQRYEGHVRRRIENVVACEGAERVERLEGRRKWAERLRAANFRGVGFGDGAVAEVKAMIGEHATGWGMKKEEDDIVLTWKGHNVVFASAWLPC